MAGRPAGAGGEIGGPVGALSGRARLIAALPDVVTLAGLLFAAAGLWGAAAPGFLATRNSAGVARWVPTLFAALFVLAALFVRVHGEGYWFRPLAALFAVAAACFARPGARELGLGYPALEAVLFGASALVALAAVRAPPGIARRTLLAVAAAPAAVYLAVELSAARAGTDAWLYAMILVAMIAGAAVALRSGRRFERWA